MKHQDVSPIQETTALQKCVAAGTGFGFACLTFFLSALVLVPLTGHLGQVMSLPSWMIRFAILFELFGLTSMAGLAGVLFAVRHFLKPQ